VKKIEGNAGVSRYVLSEMGEDAVYILLAMLRFGIRHYMGKRSSSEEEKVVNDLHYDIPKNRWNY
jgi:hypothetical protein